MNQRRRDIWTATKRAVSLAREGSLNAAHAELLSLMHQQPGRHALRQALVLIQQKLSHPEPTSADLAFLLRREDQEPTEGEAIARITPTRRRMSRSQDVTATGLRDARARDATSTAPHQDSCDMLPDGAPRRPDTVPRNSSGTSNPTLEVPVIDDSLVTNSVSSEQGEAAVDEIVQRIEFLANEGQVEDAYDLAEMMMATAANDARVRAAWKYAREVRYKALVQQLLPLSRVPKLNDHSQGLDTRLEPGTMFVLGLVDGFMNIEDIIDVSGLPQADAMAALLKLVDLQLIEI